MAWKLSYTRYLAQGVLVLAMIMTVVAITAVVASPAVVGVGHYCNAMTGQCGFRGDGLLEDVEEMDRRQLGVSYLQARHISYGALSRDRVPCSRVGRSYYGCRGSGPVNPYRRYCSRITRCARDDS